jgi:hypothetical protein
MQKYTTVNHRRSDGREICDVVEISPEWIDPRKVAGMQGVDVKTATEFVNQKNKWQAEWIPGW